MATLTTKLTLTSSNATTDALNLSLSDPLTVTEPLIGISRVDAPASSSSALEIVSNTAVAKYIYIKNTGTQSDGSTAATHELKVKLGTVASIRLAAGEFCFFPVEPSLAVNLHSEGSQLIITEYAYWTRG